MSEERRLLPGSGAMPKTAHEMRAMVDSTVEALNINLPSLERYWEGIAYRTVGGTPVMLDIARPTGDGPFPVLVYLHGGAWVCGSTRTHRRLIHRFAEAGFLVVAADYRLAPEHPYPAALEDCVEAIDWANAHAAEYGGDGRAFAVAGDSAGANLAAAAVGVLAERSGAPHAAALGLFYGYYDYEQMHELGREQRASQPGGPGEIVTSAYFGSVDPDPVVLRDPGVSPIHRAGKFPPTLLICGEHDPFSQQHEILAERLTEFGVENEHVMVAGSGHGFMQMEDEDAVAVTHVRRAADTLQAWLSRDAAS